jgi:hypothetical protein
VDKVQASQAHRQRKRTENLRERSLARKGAAGKKKARPGFEGAKARFRPK